MLSDFSINQYAHSGEHCHFISWDDNKYIVIRYTNDDTNEVILNCSGSCQGLKKEIVHFYRGGPNGTEYLLTDYSFCHKFNEPIASCSPCKSCYEFIIDPLTLLEL